MYIRGAKFYVMGGGGGNVALTDIIDKTVEHCKCGAGFIGNSTVNQVSSMYVVEITY